MQSMPLMVSRKLPKINYKAKVYIYSWRNMINCLQLVHIISCAWWSIIMHGWKMERKINRCMVGSWPTYNISILRKISKSQRKKNGKKNPSCTLFEWEGQQYWGEWSEFQIISFHRSSGQIHWDPLIPLWVQKRTKYSDFHETRGETR